MIDRFCSILRFVAETDGAPTVRDVADGLGLPRATAYRLISQLRDEGVLQAAGDGGMELGSDFLKLVISAASRKQIGEIFAGLMDAVAGHFEETAFLGRFDGDNVSLINAATPPDASRSYIFPGLGVQPIHACSSSRAILAFMDDDEIARLIPERLRRLTDRTVTTVEGLYVELRETRRRGYSICDEEMAIGITSVAVPVDIGPATGLMSLGIVGPTKRIYARGIDDIGRDLSVMVGRASPRLSNPVQHTAGVHDWVI